MWLQRFWSNHQNCHEYDQSECDATRSNHFEYWCGRFTARTQFHGHAKRFCRTVCWIGNSWNTYGRNNSGTIGQYAILETSPKELATIQYVFVDGFPECDRPELLLRDQHQSSFVRMLSNVSCAASVISFFEIFKKEILFSSEHQST